MSVELNLNAKNVTKADYDQILDFLDQEGYSFGGGLSEDGTMIGTIISQENFDLDDEDYIAIDGILIGYISEYELTSD